MCNRACASTLLTLLLALAGCLVPDGHGSTPGRSPGWRAAAAVHQPSVGAVNLTQLREESAGMFRFGFGQYMQHAFPRDDLRPISCRGKDSQGGIALTLIDSLDTLIVMGERQQLRDAVRWLAANATFDVDARVHVFELTIRAVGGLLSAHMLLEQDPGLVPGYDGSLLRLAVDLTDRFMPAFDTPTRIPLSWVNLRKGQIPGDVRATCTACAGTLLLEFGVLSRLTGEPRYEAAARGAVEAIFGMRSPRGLVGNTLDCDSGQWVRTDAGVGAGVDSFYEYLLKAYLAFGDESYLDMFKEVYAAAMTSLQLDPNWNGNIWLVDVDMQTGSVLHPYVWSLGAFWPGLQALAGQVEEGAALHANWTSAWHRFGWLPEMFDVSLENRHPTESGYPLRPELMESTYLLHAAAGDPRLLAVGASLHARLRDKNRAACGYASVGDVGTGQLEDTMESFFLSETVKYLYLLFSNASAVVDYFVLSTEGHLLPPFPDQPGGSTGAGAGTCSADGGATNATDPAADSGGACRGSPPQQGSLGQQEQQEGAEGRGAGAQHDPPSAQQQQQQQETHGAAADAAGARFSVSAQWDDLWQRHVRHEVGRKCRPLCRLDAEQQAEAAAALRAALPLLPLPPGAPALLRARRCTACWEVTRAVWHAEWKKAQAASVQAQARIREAEAKVQLGSAPAVSASGQPVNRQFLCVMEEVRKGSLGCAIFRELPARQISQRGLNALPQNFMLIQLTDTVAPAPGATAQQQTQQQELAPPDACPADGSGGGPTTDVISLELLLPNGTVSQHQSMLADFGPLFELGCWEGLGGSPAGSSAAAGSGAAGGTGGAAPGHAAAPPMPLQWQGLPVQVTEGGPSGLRFRVLRVLESAGQEEEEEEEDPYLDDDDGEVEGHLGAVGGSRGGQEEEETDPYEDPLEDGEEDQAASGGSGGSSSGDGGGGVAASWNASGPAAMCLVEGPLVAADPLDACGALKNAARLNGTIALVQRGSCMFVNKVLAVQAAGAVAAVVVNTEAQGLMSMGTDHKGTQSSIPAVLVSGHTGAQLLRALEEPLGSESVGSEGAGSVHLRLHGPGQHAHAGGAARPQHATHEAQQAQQAQQQVELLLSHRAQVWLFNKVASSGAADTNAAFARILEQLQAHFTKQPPLQAAAP
ncbi:hypothetical protein ABPG77_008745 [Micractinium sp. CCAP 211/92]